MPCCFVTDSLSVLTHLRQAYSSLLSVLSSVVPWLESTAQTYTAPTRLPLKIPKHKRVKMFFIPRASITFQLLSTHGRQASKAEHGLRVSSKSRVMTKRAVQACDCSSSAALFWINTNFRMSLKWALVLYYLIKWVAQYWLDSSHLLTLLKSFNRILLETKLSHLTPPHPGIRYHQLSSQQMRWKMSSCHVCSGHILQSRFQFADGELAVTWVAFHEQLLRLWTHLKRLSHWSCLSHFTNKA